MGKPESRPRSRAKNLSITAIAGTAGCMITVGVVGSLLVGLWLDAQFGLRGPFTIGLVIISAPISLFLVLRLVLRLVAEIQPPPKTKPIDTDSSNGGGHL